MTISNEFINKLTKEGLKKPFPRPHIVAIKWLVLMTIYFAVLVSFSGFRPDILEKFNQSLYLIELFSMLLTAIVAAYAASFLALPDSNQKSWIRFLPFVPLAFLTGILVRGIYTSEALSLTECLKLGYYQCILHIMLYSILPAVMMFYTIQKAAPIKCCWAGSMAGLSVASFGYVALRLISKSDDPTLLLVWHFLPVLMIVMIGMILGKIFLGRIWYENR